MADSYTVLYGKYSRALVSIRELEQQKEFYMKELEELQKSNKQVEKSTRYLCETILKKDRELKDKKSDVWFRKSLLEMLDVAQSSLENYFPSINKMISELLANNSERTKTIIELRAKIKKDKEDNEKKFADMCRQKDNVIEELKKTMETSDYDKKSVEKIVNKGQAKMVSVDQSLGETETSFEEEEDELSETIESAVEGMANDGDAIVPFKGVGNVKMSDDTKNNFKKTTKKLMNNKENEVNSIVNHLTQIQMLIIRVIGKYGVSLSQDIIDIIINKDKPDKIPSSARINMELKKEVDKPDERRTIDKNIISAPPSSKLCIYKLSDIGKEIYKILYKEPSVKSECEILRSEHTSLEHGYGIKNTALLISAMPYIIETNTKTVYLTRNKDYEIKINDKSSYIPDIVLITPKANPNTPPRKWYIEYETCNCNERDLFIKCNKMSLTTKNLNFIVPNNTAKNILMERINKWKALITENANAPSLPENLSLLKLAGERVTIRVATYNELDTAIKEKNAKRGIPWPTVNSFTIPRK